MTVPNIPVKKLKATVTIELPLLDADPQDYQTYNVQEMAAVLKTQLETDLFEAIEGPYQNDTLSIDANVEVVDAPQGD